VLAFVRRRVAADHAQLSPAHVSGGLTFLGLQGMMDPPRAEAAEAVRDCLRAGVRVKMITGDHAVTAATIARQLGLKGATHPDGSLRAVTGNELTQVSDAALPQLAEDTAVFARVAPEQKLRLVRALQARGHVVAMTGDGVNDAPALKQADIGIAMGITGTDVAKGAAAMVLTDDNFASIKAAVEEGRNVFDNLVKFIVWTLPTNGGEGLLLLTAIVLGAELPVLPVQLLWINLTTAIFLGLMLVFEPKEPGLMDRPPRDPQQPLLSRPLVMRTLFVSLLMQLGGYGLFLWEQRVHGASVTEARTIVVNLIVVAECFYLLNCRSLTQPFFRLGWFSNAWIWAGIIVMLGAQLLFNYLPLMNRLFHTAPVRADTWLHVSLVGLAVFVLIELEKRLRFRHSPGNLATSG
jgi:magnesium-transporting ATPase (P-type)